jgi:class 3 adenylate cyclase
MPSMPRPQRRSFTEPEEVRRFPHGTLSIIKLDEVVVGHYRLEPGWKWSNDIQPIAGTPFCQHHHMGYCQQGQLHVVLKDGTTYDVRAGDAYEIPPGHDAWVEGDETYLGIEFSGSRTFAIPPEAMDTAVIATLLFTDIVGSTAVLERVGDAAWLEMLRAHNVAMRAELERYRGRELKTTGDGFLASFDSASRAVRCGQAMVAAARAGGLDVRVGCHTGEVELVQGDAHGVAVHAAARVMALAGAGQVFASWTTRDLLAGSGISVETAGRHELKGLEGEREIFRIR